MFSLPKLIVLVLIILGVLYGFRIVNSLKRRETRANTPSEPKPERQREQERLEAEDLVQCPRCGAYVTPGGDHECRRQA